MANDNKITVYFSFVPKEWPEGEFDRLMRVIPKALQDKVMEEEGWQNQYGSLARKLMLWHGMEQAGANMNDLFDSVQYTVSGKPYLIDAPHFSLANDGTASVCAISAKSELGIDIARLKPINLSDFREMMTFSEWREIYSHVIPLQRFYEFWTIKESVIKADGLLVGMDVKEIFIQPDVAFCNAKYWYINPIEIDLYGYISFLVCSNPHADIEVETVDLLKLF